jgi:WD40 repeat protein
MEPLRIFTAHSAGVRSFAYSKTSKIMVSVGQAPTRGMVWNPAGGSVECCKHGKPGAKPGNGKCKKCDDIHSRRGTIVGIAEETPGDFGASSFAMRKNKRLVKAQRRLAAMEERMSGRLNEMQRGFGGGSSGANTSERCSVMSVIEGHSTTIVHVVMDDDNGRFMTVSEDKIIRCHDYGTLRCMQIIHDRYVHMPDNTLSAVMWDSQRQILIAAGQKVKMWRLRKFFKTTEVTSHAAPVTVVLHNKEFGQVVSSDAESNVCIWELETGENAFGYDEVHDGDKITAMSFDVSGRRLVTGSDNGQCRMWNFNCGTELYELYRPPTYTVNDEPTQSELDAMDRLYAQSVQGSLDQTSVSVSSAIKQSMGHQSSVGPQSIAGSSQRTGVECSISDLTSAAQAGTERDLSAKYVCAAGSDRRIYLYDDQLAENSDPDKPQMPINALPRHGDAGHDDDIQCLLAVPPTMLASCGCDGQIIIWDLAIRRSACTFNLRAEEHVHDVDLFLKHQTNVMRLQAKAQRRRDRLMDNDSSDEEGDKNNDFYADEPMSGVTGVTGNADWQSNAFLATIRQQRKNSLQPSIKQSKKQVVKKFIEYEEKDARKATVECMTLLPHMNCIVASGSDSIIRFWNLETHMLHYALRAWHPNNQTIVKIATDESNHHIVSACAIGYIRVFRVVHYGLENVLANKGLSPDDRMVLPVFSISGWQAHDEALTCMKVAEHAMAGTLLITASGDCCINIWTIEGSKVGTFGQPKPWSLSNADTWETIHPEKPQLELPPMPGLAALSKGQLETSSSDTDPSSPAKLKFESSIATMKEEKELRKKEAEMRYDLHKATINSRAEHREGHNDMREELRKSLTPAKARWESHFYEFEAQEKARTAAAMGQGEIKISSKHRDIGRELGHVAHELDLSKKRPESLHDKQRWFRDRVTELKLQLPGQKSSRRPSEVEFDGLMNAARNFGV